MMQYIGRIVNFFGQRLVRIGSRLQDNGRNRSARRQFQKYPQPMKLHVGCGPLRLDGWVNIDLSRSSTVDVIVDATQLPAPDASCELIYSEHFLEHLSVESAVAFFRQSLRVLQSGGVLRTAMPSITSSIHRYLQDGDWKSDPIFERSPVMRAVETRAEMINVCFRSWGHQWLYDEEELERRLVQAGFSQVRVMAWGDSEHAALRGLETRPESTLICEATKL